MDTRKQKTRSAIFNAYSKLAQTKNFERMSVSELCKEAQIARVTFYQHFETKEALLDGLCDELFLHSFTLDHHNIDHSHSELAHTHTHEELFEEQLDSSYQADHELEHLKEAASHLLLHIRDSRFQLDRLFKGEWGVSFALRFSSHFVRHCEAQLLRLYEHERLSEAVPYDLWKESVAFQFMSCLMHWARDLYQEDPHYIATCFINLSFRR